MSALRTAVDRVLELTVLGSFTKIGPAVRRRTAGWEPVDANLSDETILITGGSSGIGRAAATHLVALGATVAVTSRSQDRADDAAAEINADASDDAGRAQGFEVDTSDFDSIDQLVTDLDAIDRITVLIHNAGALTADRHENERGLEMTLASHLVGPYYLTKRLRDRMSVGGRIVWMSSGGMYTQGLDVDELEMDETSYRRAVAYARAKRAQVELVTHLGPIWAPEVVMHAMHPGWVETDGVSSGILGFGTVMGPLLRSVDDGADTLVWSASGGGGDVPPGSFFLDRRPRATSYLPGTSATTAERQRLVEWLELMTLPATAG